MGRIGGGNKGALWLHCNLRGEGEHWASFAASLPITGRGNRTRKTGAAIRAIRHGGPSGRARCGPGARAGALAAATLHRAACGWTGHRVRQR